MFARLTGVTAMFGGTMQFLIVVGLSLALAEQTLGRVLPNVDLYGAHPALAIPMLPGAVIYWLAAYLYAIPFTMNGFGRPEFMNMDDGTNDITFKRFAESFVLQLLVTGAIGVFGMLLLFPVIMIVLLGAAAFWLFLVLLPFEWWHARKRRTMDDCTPEN
ncbi:MAG: hypothetical protein A2848_00415 [Candidatus Magasanikbacteria bacterium RIFCSPHIGHO2_01_FULL_50_8]|uniref:Uncharacterized protein n=2 Tax=Candidatus Magasanikiibacteriota TaxID=1752731 RepID=A0A1F6LR19_9BACT|nr:MAG: hypothetical protein A2848_00415 [Candidatus Magasanikbacteria bacterium RIFCSPHIGHO2_01_FULL_50_8]OGH67949.1 MAG: hypothetical protein A3C15_00250 [Candidatus Magasanikbacteria bacterium RIFCSPHIGHO2_02_FULL_50_9b]